MNLQILKGHIGDRVEITEESLIEGIWQALRPEPKTLLDADQDHCLFVGMPCGYFALFDGSSRRIKEIKIGDEVLYERS